MYCITIGSPPVAELLFIEHSISIRPDNNDENEGKVVLSVPSVVCMLCVVEPV